MIEFKQASFAYGENIILKDFNLRVREGKITAVLGQSGCGKTTLLNLIAGVLKIESGELKTANAVSYVFQEPRLIAEKTVFENLNFILKRVIKDKSLRRQTITDGLKSAGLEDCLNLYPMQLSGGMAQRVSLLRAFLFPSDTLLLDEPFKGLDEETKKSITDTFLSLYHSAPRTVILVTHDLADAHALADFIITLDSKPLMIKSEYKNEKTAAL